MLHYLWRCKQCQKMILIIEDEESIQNIIKAFLEDAGYTVVLAADGLDGIEQFRRTSLTWYFWI